MTLNAADGLANDLGSNTLTVAVITNPVNGLLAINPNG